MAMIPDPATLREDPEAVVLTSYHIYRGVAHAGDTALAPIIISLNFAECVIMYEEDGITPKTTVTGTTAYRKARQGSEWTIHLDLSNPAHLGRAMQAMGDACEAFANAVYTLDGINKTPEQLETIGQALLAAGLPDAALAQAGENIEVARRAGATDMQVNK